MTILRQELRERVQIQVPVQTPNDDGGFNRSYSTLKTVWAGLKPIRKGFYIRGVQVDTNNTHEFKIRRAAIDTLGGAFSLGFSLGFTMGAHALSRIKSDFFLFVQRGSTIKGRLFRINQLEDSNERREYYIIRAEEIEEVGPNYII